MIIKCYEEIFRVSETLQNGKERTKKISVLCPIFIDGKHVIQLKRIDEAIKELETLHYYNIEHVETKHKNIITTGDLITEGGKK